MPSFLGLRTIFSFVRFKKYPLTQIFYTIFSDLRHFLWHQIFDTVRLLGYQIFYTYYFSNLVTFLQEQVFYMILPYLEILSNTNSGNFLEHEIYNKFLYYFSYFGVQYFLYFIFFRFGTFSLAPNFFRLRNFSPKPSRYSVRP